MQSDCEKLTDVLKQIQSTLSDYKELFAVKGIDLVRKKQEEKDLLEEIISGAYYLKPVTACRHEKLIEEFFVVQKEHYVKRVHQFGEISLLIEGSDFWKEYSTKRETKDYLFIRYDEKKTGEKFYGGVHKETILYVISKKMRRVATVVKSYEDNYVITWIDVDEQKNGIRVVFGNDYSNSKKSTERFIAFDTFKNPIEA